jgi:hypothetical protein
LQHSSPHRIWRDNRNAEMGSDTRVSETYPVPKTDNHRAGKRWQEPNVGWQCKLRATAGTREPRMIVFMLKSLTRTEHHHQSEGQLLRGEAKHSMVCSGNVSPRLAVKSFWCSFGYAPNIGYPQNRDTVHFLLQRRSSRSYV